MTVLVYCPTCRSSDHASHSLEACLVTLRERVDKLESDGFWIKRWIYEQAQTNDREGPGLGPVWDIESPEERLTPRDS